MSGDMEYDIGVSRHEWRTRWEALEPDLEDEPQSALPAAVGLLEEMASELETGDDPTLDEWQRDLAEARNTARRLDAGDDVAMDEVQTTVEVLRELYLDLADEE